jgi:predicted PurR-regulated permease PerM
VLAALALVLVPLLETQIVDLVGRIPHYADLARAKAMELLDLLRAHLSAEEMANLRAKIGGIAGPSTLALVGRTLGRVLGGGVALFNLLSLLVVTPIVAFYLLRDWDRLIATVDGWLPPRHADEVRGIARDIDHVLSGFVRGQVTVCLALAAYYGIGLSLAGLEFGLIIGIATGLLSFVPIFGMMIGFLVGIGVALAQFGLTFGVVLVLAVFLVGQIVEGQLLTPRLVGSRVGLHPVWTIFALLAGGAIAGFTGLLLAVPVAAVIGVVSRFGLRRYRASAVFDPDRPAIGGGE